MTKLPARGEEGKPSTLAYSTQQSGCCHLRKNQANKEKRPKPYETATSSNSKERV